MIRGAWLSFVITGALSAGPAFAQDGAAVYARACVSCHEQGAVARAPSREVISALSVERIVGALETGTMRTQGEALTPAERRAVATFLSTDRAAAATSTRSARLPARRFVRARQTGSRGACRWPTNAISDRAVSRRLRFQI